MSILEKIQDAYPDAPSLEEMAQEIEISIPVERRKLYKGDVDDLPGTPMTREMLGDMEVDPRDKLSKDRRLKEFDDLQFRHLWHLKNRPPEHAHFSKLMHGDMGGGKTLSVVDEAKALYTVGVPIFSNASLFFGQRVQTEEVATYADVLPHIVGLVVDEIHDLISRYASNTAVARMFGISAAAMQRKMGMRLLSASVHEGELPFSYKATIDWSILCTRFRPRSGRYIAPEWCYILQRRWGPKPHRFKGIADEWDVLEESQKVRMQTKPVHPYRIWETAHLYDSFELVKMGQGYLMTSEKLRRSMDKRQEDQGTMAVLQSFVQLINSGWSPRTEKVHWKILATQCYDRGGLSPGISEKAVREELVRIVDIDAAKFVWTHFVAEFDDAEMERNEDYQINESYYDDDDDFTIIPPDDGWPVGA